MSDGPFRSPETRIAAITASLSRAAAHSACVFAGAASSSRYVQFGGLEEGGAGAAVMEVASGIYGRRLFDKRKPDPLVVEALSSRGFTYKRGENFQKQNVSGPATALAEQVEEIMTSVLGCAPDFTLEITEGI